jgi:hypothetical protein
MVESMGLLIGASIEEEVLRKLKEAKASPENPVDPEKLKLTRIEKNHLKLLVKRKIVAKTHEGRYYIIKCQDKKHC